ncbi:hypothetical protein L3Q82_001607 [Scortum barcoo]|uniref:Uncharacterized protein n=1 Tax=Scortum barcoo TaxID=214431 RepID=A0ACB8W5T0_9TELE|nr:hypothetical protein L3Q82_001607 [Scortum barcoo]
MKFADDTAVVGRIANNDESDYRQEVEHLEGWCRQNNLCINVKKTKEMIVDFRRGRHLPSPLYIGGTAVEVVSSFRYLGVHISDDLTWSKNTSCLIRKAHQHLYFLRRLRRAGLGSSVLTSFYRCVVESVLSSCIIVWHGSCSAAEKKALQRVVKAAQRTVGRTKVSAYYLASSCINCKFIRYFSSIASLLTTLTCTKVPFCWSDTTHQAFETLKTHFTTAPIPQFPGTEWQFAVEVDASSLRVGAVLSQHPTTDQKLLCFSQCLSP